MKILNTIPEKFDGPSAWVGVDLQTSQSQWLYTLTADDISEIEHAARHFLSLGRDVGEITAQDFPLPQFTDHLQNMSEKL
ncbi:MAG: TauD/TfdA family dioxygenase, partial [Rhodobacteraceae bacterium]|nr:TauD/TfdA family dioxygenase [Paracoccaceae bacterium]